MAEFARVRDQLTGHEYSINSAVAKGDPKRYTVLDDDTKPAVDHDGRPLAPKYNIKSVLAAEKTAKATAAAEAKEATK